jgi:hypothetical protein
MDYRYTSLQIYWPIFRSSGKIMKHEAPVYNSMHRVLATNYKTGKCTKTVGWITPCSCGLIIQTKQNSIKTHKAKVTKHVELANA